MVIKTPQTILELECVTVDSFYDELISYSDKDALRVWQSCDRETGYLDILLESGKRVTGNVTLVSFIPTRIGGPPRVFVFDYAKSLNLIGEARIKEQRNYAPLRINM